MEEQENIQSEAKPEIHPKNSLGGSLRWVVVTVVAFGLGALIVVLALYVPTWQKLDKANANLTSKTDQVTTLQAGNDTLQKNLDATTLHMYLLKALSGVSRASLAVTTDDYAGARLSLIQASEALDTLSGLLGTDHKDVLSAMQKSAAQALTAVKTDLKSAQPELVQLTKNLVQLEDNQFPNP